jgi:hypothetical protein
MQRYPIGAFVGQIINLVVHRPDAADVVGGLFKITDGLIITLSMAAIVATAHLARHQNRSLFNSLPCAQCRPWQHPIGRYQI